MTVAKWPTKMFMVDENESSWPSMAQTFKGKQSFSDFWLLSIMNFYLESNVNS